MIGYLREVVDTAYRDGDSSWQVRDNDGRYSHHPQHLIFWSLYKINKTFKNNIICSCTKQQILFCGMWYVYVVQ